MKLGIDGKIAVVGGASKGLGFAAAESLLREGARVAIAARDEKSLLAAADSLEEATGSRPLPVPTDLTKPADREALVERVERKLGAVQILVANAGGPPPGPFESHGPDDWQLAIDLALGNVTHLCAMVLPKMKATGFGRIAQIVSIAGLEVVDGLILSNASRPAVLGFAKALAREVASHGIMVNSVCPGIFLTDRIRELAVERARRSGITPEEYVERLGEEIPAGRPGEPGELGDLIAFLCSKRNTYITGAAIPIDGGRTRRIF